MPVCARSFSPWIWAIPLAAGLVWIFACGYDGLTGADSNDYRWVAGQWHDWFTGGPRPVMLEHPPGYPLAGATLGWLAGDTHRAMRLLPLVGFLVAGWMIGRVCRTAEPERAGIIPLFLLLTFGASPFLLRYAFVVLSDLPGLALTLVVFAALLKGMTTGGTRWVLLAVVAAAGAISVRYAALPVMASGAAYAIWQGQKTRWLRPFIAVSIGLVVVGMIAVSLPGMPWTGRTMGTPLQDWSLLNWFRTEHDSDDGHLSHHIPNFLYVLSAVVHPGFLPCGALLLPFVRRVDLSGPVARMAIAVLAGYLAFIAGMPFQNDRVLLLAQPYFVLLLWPAFARAWEWVATWRSTRVWLLGGLVMLQMVLFLRAMWPFIRQARQERELASEIKGLGATAVYTHALAPVLRNRCPSVEVTDLWYGPVAHFRSGALIIVNEANLREQWRDLHPWKNWNRAVDQGIVRLKEREDGWVIARVE